MCVSLCGIQQKTVVRALVITWLAEKLFPLDDGSDILDDERPKVVQITRNFC